MDRLTTGLTTNSLEHNASLLSQPPKAFAGIWLISSAIFLRIRCGTPASILLCMLPCTCCHMLPHAAIWQHSCICACPLLSMYMYSNPSTQLSRARVCARDPTQTFTMVGQHDIRCSVCWLLLVSCAHACECTYTCICVYYSASSDLRHVDSLAYHSMDSPKVALAQLRNCSVVRTIDLSLSLSFLETSAASAFQASMKRSGHVLKSS